MGRKFRSLQRTIANRQPKKKIVIYSEGEKTERDYFEAIKRTYQASVIEIQIIEGAGVPLTISRKAVDAAKAARRLGRRQSYALRDEFWALFDRDNHPNVPDAIHRCAAGNVGIAFSNPCFELWLVLHFQDFDKPDGHHDVQRHLETICADYNRHSRKTTDCSKLMHVLEEAEQRAEKQLARRHKEGDPPGPPFTTVFQLTRRIRVA